MLFVYDLVLRISYLPLSVRLLKGYEFASSYDPEDVGCDENVAFRVELDATDRTFVFHLVNGPGHGLDFS